jgi:hypothetical protein
MTMNKDEQARRSPSGRVVCPRCGSEMNHHAEKLDYCADPSDASFDEVLGGVLMEFHACPGCKYELERAAP